jgi:hypothetical protein
MAPVLRITLCKREDIWALDETNVQCCSGDDSRCSEVGEQRCSECGDLEDVDSAGQNVVFGQVVDGRHDQAGDSEYNCEDDGDCTKYLVSKSTEGRGRVSVARAVRAKKTTVIHRYFRWLRRQMIHARQTTTPSLRTY